MQTFDRETWLAKAKKSRNPSNVQSVDGIDKLVKWSLNEGIKISFGRAHGGSYTTTTKSIVISSNLCATNQLHYLIHEIGHHLIAVGSRSMTRTSKGYKNPNSETSNDRSDHYKIDLLEEEYEAWARGLKHANDIDLKLDIDLFNKTKVNAIKSYVRWVAGLIKD